MPYSIVLTMKLLNSRGKLVEMEIHWLRPKKGKSKFRKNISHCLEKSTKGKKKLIKMTREYKNSTPKLLNSKANLRV